MSLDTPCPVLACIMAEDHTGQGNDAASRREGRISNLLNLLSHSPAEESRSGVGNAGEPFCQTRGDGCIRHWLVVLCAVWVLVSGRLRSVPRKMASMAMMGWWSDECFECFHDVRSLVCANQNRIFLVLGWNVRLGSNLAAVTAPGPSKPAEKL